MPTGEGNVSAGSGLTREQALDELDFLATVEHALVVEYLSVHCALGHDLPAADAGAPAQQVRRAAEAAFGLALGEMGHLQRVNRGLIAAGRPPQIGRAASIGGDAGSEIAFGPLGPAQLERLLDREREIAAAVDARYAPLCRAVTSRDTPFDGELLGQMTSILDPCPDHSAPLAELQSRLAGIAPSVYLRATRRDPRSELERSLLELSDLYYDAIVATVEAWFAFDDQLGGELRGRALATMDSLNAINGLLVSRGLLPGFALRAPAGR